MARAALEARGGGERRLGGAAALAAWMVGLGAAIAVLHLLGGGRLAGPPLTRPGAWSGWLADRDAATAAVAILRVVTLGIAWYLVVATIVVTTAELTRFGRLVSVADVVALPVVRRVVHGAFGVGLAASTLAALGAGNAQEAAPTRADLRMAVAASPTAPGTATMQRLDAEPGTATMTRLGADPRPAEPAAPAPATGATWVAVPGDHLWSIAARTLEATWGRAGTEAEIAGYWQAVVEANRSTLTDPDLLPVGTAVVLPPVPLA